MRVFLSHADEDALWARQLSVALHRKGIEVLDPSAKAFPGKNPYLALGQALERADALVFLISPRFSKSSRVDTELEFALFQPRFKGRLAAVVRSRDHAAAAPWIVRRLNSLIVTRDPLLAAKRLADQFLGQHKGRGRRASVASWGFSLAR